MNKKTNDCIYLFISVLSDKKIEIDDFFKLLDNFITKINLIKKLDDMISSLSLQHKFDIAFNCAEKMLELTKNTLLEELPIKIKWPNDIYLEEQKIAGILIENSIRSNGSWQWAIIGIGINVNQSTFSQELPNPISLFQITKKKNEPATLAKSLCLSLTTELNHLLAIAPQQLLEQYQQHLYKRGEICQFSRAGASFSAIPTGITPNGELLLDRIEHPIAFGEIEWKITLA